MWVLSFNKKSLYSKILIYIDHIYIYHSIMIYICIYHAQMNNFEIVFHILYLVFHFSLLLPFMPCLSCLRFVLYMSLYVFFSILFHSFLPLQVDGRDEVRISSVAYYILSEVGLQKWKWLPFVPLLLLTFFSCYVSLDVFCPFHSSLFVIFWRLMGETKSNCQVMQIVYCQQKVRCSSQKLHVGYSHSIFLFSSLVTLCPYFF